MGRSVCGARLCATAHAGDLSVVGTGDGIDLLRALGAAYTADHPETNVIVPPSIGSGGGIAAVGSDKEVLARIARPLSDSEKEAGLVATPVFRLPSAFFVHRAAGVSGLTSAQLADIYRGKITNWREVGGADLRIKVVRREDQDSTLLVLRQSMPGWKDLAITDKSKTAVTTQDCIDTVKEVAGAIGFGPFTRALEMELAVLKIDGRHPTDRDYPSAVTLSFVHKDSDRDARRQAFHRLRQGREGAHGPDANGRRSGRRVTIGNPRGQGLAPPFFAQHPADHRGRRDRDGRVRGLVRPDHRPARSGPRAPGRAARRGSRRKSSASASTAKRASPARALEALFSNFAARLESIAQRADVVKALSSANVVAISELLGRAAQAADIDGILVVDTKLRVFGAASDKVDIVAANRAAAGQPARAGHPRHPRRQRPQRPRVVRRTLTLIEDLAQALGAPATAPLAFVVAEPIFDDFGDVFAALIAYRTLRPREAVLEEFSRLEGAGVRGAERTRTRSRSPASRKRRRASARPTHPRCCAPATAATGRAATPCSSTGASARWRRSASCTRCATS